MKNATEELIKKEYLVDTPSVMSGNMNTRDKEIPPRILEDEVTPQEENTFFFRLRHCLNK